MFFRGNSANGVRVYGKIPFCTKVQTKYPSVGNTSGYDSTWFYSPEFVPSEEPRGDLFILNIVVLPPMTLPSAPSGLIMRLLFSLRAVDTVDNHRMSRCKRSERPELRTNDLDCSATRHLTSHPPPKRMRLSNVSLLARALFHDPFFLM